VGTKGWAGFEAVFTEDAVADSTPPGEKQSEWVAMGVVNIAVLVKNVIASTVTVHHGYMPEIDVTSPATAKAIWSLEDLIW
jgi:hypothetical protein